MTDNHVHIGWYSDGYHYPLEVWKAEQDAGFSDIVVSSTSTCAELYKLVKREICELKKVGGSHVHPLLWVTPRMMKTWGIRYLLHSKIQWRGVKMHWGAHPEWFYDRKLVCKALEIARKRNIPVLVHTGGAKECEPKVFEEMIRQYDDLKFVLAHGRPIEQTIEVMKAHSNTYVDTAFMCVEDVSKLIRKGFVDRILFGSDAPINLVYHKNETVTDYLKGCIKQFSASLSMDQYETIMNNQLYK